MTKFRKIHDGEEFTQNLNEGLLLKCCDCGLTHRIRFKAKSPNTIGITMWRHPAKTKAVAAAKEKV